MRFMLRRCAPLSYFLVATLPFGCSATRPTLRASSCQGNGIRQAALQPLRSGDGRTGLESARAAQSLHSTPAGGLLQSASALANGQK